MNNMKLFMVVCVLIATVALTMGVGFTGVPITNKSDCKCFEGFEPYDDSLGTGYYCKATKNQPSFNCNEEKPPLCRCVVNGNTITLDLGHTNCYSVNLQNGRWCQNQDEWIAYFKKHPEHAIYD